MSRRDLKLSASARHTFKTIKADALAAKHRRLIDGQTKTSHQEGLFAQVWKTLDLLAENVRHPGLKTHKYDAIANPVRKGESVFEAYAQNNTPGAYRVFWCYGPGDHEVYIVAITPHP